MHPFGTYLAITTLTREQHRVAPESHPAAFAPIEGRPPVELKPRSRIGRLTRIVRRHVLRTAGA